MKNRIPAYVRKLISSQPKRGIKLDLGCGGHKQEGFLGMDMRKTPCVDIVHNIQEFPFPLPDECCSVILASHIIEHINPANQTVLKLFNELWRIMEVGGQLWISLPYGMSHGYIQDPTHCNPCNESTWQYFDPDFPLFDVYCHTQKPWKLVRNVYQITGNMEVILEKRPASYVGQFSPKTKGGAK